MSGHGRPTRSRVTWLELVLVLVTYVPAIPMSLVEYFYR